MFDVDLTPANRTQLGEVLSLLVKHGGRVVVFEHNPLNPITRFVVSRTPIDRNAIALARSSIGTSSGGSARPAGVPIADATPVAKASARNGHS